MAQDPSASSRSTLGWVPVSRSIVPESTSLWRRARQGVPFGFGTLLYCPAKCGDRAAVHLLVGFGLVALEARGEFVGVLEDVID